MSDWSDHRTGCAIDDRTALYSSALGAMQHRTISAEKSSFPSGRADW
jgi:hypothetical protein